MKKTTTNVWIVFSGAAENMVSIELNGSASDVFDALKAHRDIEHTVLAEAPNPSMKYVIPFHGVDMAMIARAVETVTAPTDAVCGE